MPPPILTGTVLALAMLSTDWPPERFRGDAIATVSFLDPAEVSKVCSRSIPAGAGTVYACTRQTRAGNTYIVVPRPGSVPDEEFARLVGHEIGHLRGWSREHEK